MTLDEIKNKTNDKNLVKLANSIRKYFELDLYNETLPEIDNILEIYKPENVIMILFDGMGDCFIDRYLEENSFFRENRIDTITSIYPPTTAAATTSLRTGLYPSEHGMTGWWKYIPDLDKVVITFTGREKEVLDEGEINPKYNELIEKLYSIKTTAEEIVEKGGNAIELFPFETHNAEIYDIENDNDFYDKIYNYSKKQGKKFIYAYDPEPDHTMHLEGCDCEKVIRLIRKRNKKVSELCNRLENSVVIVVADHGHINIETNIDTLEYQDFMNTLEKPISVEGRTPSFHVKNGMEIEFKTLFNKYFGDLYDLYTIDEIRESKIFGDKDREGLWNCFGNYIAIAKSTATLTDDKIFLKSHHGGPTDDEIYVPLIVKVLKK